MLDQLEFRFTTTSNVRVNGSKAPTQTFNNSDLHIEEYILCIKMVADRLAVIGQPIPDQDLVFYILGCLDSN